MIWTKQFTLVEDRQSPIFSSVTKTIFYSTLCKYGATWREKLKMCIHSVAGCPYTNMIK